MKFNKKHDVLRTKEEENVPVAPPTTIIPHWQDELFES
jgi:hypothetical protein